MVTVGNRETNLVAMVAVKANSVKPSVWQTNVFHTLSIEKEKIVIDLYYNQRKNVRQIAQEARISFRDIAAILKKEAAEVNDVGSGNGNGRIAVDNQQQQLGNDSNNNKSPSQKATQDYELYNKGRKPVEVAIQLGLSEYKATKFQRMVLIISRCIIL